MRWLIVFMVISVVSACNDQRVDGQPYPLPEGLRAQINMGGHSYELEVAEVEGRVATLQYFWQDQLVSERQQYRGLYSLAGFDGGVRFINEIDTDAIDGLFPLKVGREVSFGGVTHYDSTNMTGSLWVTLAVVDTAEVAIKDGRFEVFVIHVSTVLSIDGRNKSVTRVLYYSPDLGLPLKMDMSDGARRSYWRITSIDMPPARGRRNRLGTVMI